MSISRSFGKDGNAGMLNPLRIIRARDAAKPQKSDWNDTETAVTRAFNRIKERQQNRRN